MLHTAMPIARCDDLPFALHPIGVGGADQREQRIGERHDERCTGLRVTWMPLAISKVGTQLAKP